MSRRWEARYQGGGRFTLRRRRRGGWLVGLGLLVGAGVLTRLWERVDAWLWEVAHLTAWTASAILLIVVVLLWLWTTSGRR